MVDNNDNKITVSGKYLLRTVLLLIGLWAVLYCGSALLLPLLVAALVAILLDRTTNKLKDWGLPKWSAILITLVLTNIFLLLLFWLISSQVGNIADDWPKIQEKATEKYGHLSSWVQGTLHIDLKQFVDENIDLTDRLKSISKIFITSFTDIIARSFIVFVYTVLFLVQRKMFIAFFRKLVKNEKAGSGILIGTSEAISNYIFVKALVMLFLFVVYYLGFTFGDVPFALFLALFASIFSIIPYVSNLIGGGVAIVLAYLYSGGTPALIVIGVIALAQLLENYVLTPIIIGDKIDLNPFMTIFGVIVLSTLWGLTGAIIALPILAVLKVVFKHTRGMEVYAYLLEKHEG